MPPPDWSNLYRVGSKFPQPENFLIRGQKFENDKTNNIVDKNVKCRKEKNSKKKI